MNGWTDTILGVALGAARVFVELMVDVLPFFAIGVLAGAAVQAFVSERWTERLFGGRGAGALLSAITAGAVLPGCACATMPMASGIQGSGRARLGTLAAFIMVSPLLSPITIVLTWGMIGWEMTAARVAAAVLGSLALGVTINRFERWFSVGLAPARERALPVAVGSSCGCCSTGDACAPAAERPTFAAALRSVLRQVTPYFLVGMAIAALLTSLLPEDAVPRFLGGSAGVAAYALAALVGIPAYVCEGEEVPITFALLQHGLGPGPALTFMLGSVGTCIPTFVMARGVIGRRATTFYVAFWFALAIGAGVLFQALVSG